MHEKIKAAGSLLLLMNCSHVKVEHVVDHMLIVKVPSQPPRANGESLKGDRGFRQR